MQTATEFVEQLRVGALHDWPELLNTTVNAVAGAVMLVGLNDSATVQLLSAVGVQVSSIC